MVAITTRRPRNFKVTYHFNGKVQTANITAVSYWEACVTLTRCAKRQGKFIVIL